MSEHLSDGKFAPKEVTGSKSESNRGRFKKGRAKTGGRKPGVQNHITRDVKEFLAALVANVDVQEAVQQRIQKGDAVAFFRALEHVVGKPRETIDANITAKVKLYNWDEHDGAA